jgi:hypothetical protein
MDGWDLALLVVAGYVATTALVRLMIRRRDRMLADFGRRMADEQKRKAAREKRQQRAGQRRNAA